MTTITDRYLEGTDGQAVVLTLVDAADVAIDGAAVTEVLCTLVSEDDGTVIFEGEDCTPGGVGSRGSLNASDELVITLTAADLVAVGSRPIQRRRLTTKVTHSVDALLIYDEQTFELTNMAGAPIVAP